MPKRTRKYEKPPALDMDFDEALERFAAVTPAELGSSESDQVRLVERDGVAHPLLIYATPRGINVDLAYRGNTFWATQDQMADMFGVDRTSITKHLKNIYDEGELDRAATCEEISQVRQEGARTVTRARPVYNLNAMISVGYRVGSKQGTMFRIWATDKIVQILTKGFYIDKERLKGPEQASVLDELRETVREIRSSTQNVYREVKRICTMCQDYDPRDRSTTTRFFSMMENKLLWASVGMTAGEIIMERADTSKPDMGLTYHTGKKGDPTQGDVQIANNYLFETEARTKNRATTMLLDYFEEQLDQGRLVTMSEAERKLNEFIKFNDWPLLTHRGTVEGKAARAHAVNLLRQYKQKHLS